MIRIRNDIGQRSSVAADRPHQMTEMASGLFVVDGTKKRTGFRFINTPVRYDIESSVA